MTNSNFIDEYQIDENLSSPSLDTAGSGNVQKKRLRSWLLEKLDTNDCPGCMWLDEEQKIFKLTWKHYGRPGFDEERVSSGHPENSYFF